MSSSELPRVSPAGIRRVTSNNPERSPGQVARPGARSAPVIDQLSKAILESDQRISAISRRLNYVQDEIAMNDSPPAASRHRPSNQKQPTPVSLRQPPNYYKPTATLSRPKFSTLSQAANGTPAKQKQAPTLTSPTRAWERQRPPSPKAAPVVVGTPRQPPRYPSASSQRQAEQQPARRVASATRVTTPRAGSRPGTPLVNGRNVAPVSRPPSAQTKPPSAPPTMTDAQRNDSATRIKEKKPVYTFVYQGTSGSVFERMRQFLKRRPEWFESTVYLDEASGANKKASTAAKPNGNLAKKKKEKEAPHGSSTYQKAVSGVSAPRMVAASFTDISATSKKVACCSKLEGVSLFIGDKNTAEFLLEEAKVVAMKARRVSNALFASQQCQHPHYDNAIPSRTGVIVNYFEGMKCVTLKARLLKALQNYCKGEREHLMGILPPTFMLSPTFRDDRNQLAQAMTQATKELRYVASRAQEAKKAASNSTTTKLPALGKAGAKENKEEDSEANVSSRWIAKSSHGKGGEGIQLVHGTESGFNSVIKMVDSQPSGHVWVVQRYIERPLLYRGRKFDIRIWVLVKAPYEIYMHRDGVMRLSSKSYNQHSDDLQEHITNHCIQEDAEDYGKHEEGNELFFDSLAALVNERGQQRAAGLAGNTHGSPNKLASHKATATAAAYEQSVLPQFRRSIVHTLLAAKPNLTLDDQFTAIDRFQLMGFDYVIDENLRVWLLEVNGAPGICDRLLDKIVVDLMDIVVSPKFPPSREPAIGSTVGGDLGSTSPVRAARAEVAEPNRRSNGGFELLYSRSHELHDH